MCNTITPWAPVCACVCVCMCLWQCVSDHVSVCPCPTPAPGPTLPSSCAAKTPFSSTPATALPLRHCLRAPSALVRSDFHSSFLQLKPAGTIEVSTDAAHLQLEPARGTSSAPIHPKKAWGRGSAGVCINQSLQKPASAIACYLQGPLQEAVAEPESGQELSQAKVRPQHKKRGIREGSTS